MATAPSRVAWPPMNPVMCTKMQPGSARCSERAESRSPRHAAGSALRHSKPPRASDIARTRHEPFVSWKMTYLTAPASPRSSSSSKRCASHGQNCSSSTMLAVGSFASAASSERATIARAGHQILAIARVCSTNSSVARATAFSN
eukprot:Amastigsp_a680623_12.p4 type:complete len:145 gc:universal Amastigsp_a680623_12:123-557(+)